MGTITISVTQEDIDNGWQCQSTKCPIALSLKRQFNTDSVVAGLFAIRVETTFYKTSDEAQMWMKKFDWDKNVEPAEFTFAPVQP